MLRGSGWMQPFLQADPPAGGNPPSPPPPDPNATPPAPTVPPPPPEPAAADDAPPKDGDDKLKAQTKSYSQREFTAELRKQLTEAESKLRDKVMADIDIENAKANGELSKVIDAKDKRLRELEPLEEEVRLFRDAAETRYATEFAKLPESIQVFAPADDASILEKERWLVSKALPAAAKLTSTDPIPGLAKSNDPKAKSKTGEDVIKDIRNGYAVTGEYRPM